jgi:quercetin dioxygenase-like cupin family protein
MTGAARSGATARCAPEPTGFSYESPVIDVLRVYTGPDGLSHAELRQEPGQTSSYLGAVLRQFQFGDPSNVVIVGGPPDFRIARHVSPYREIFLILAGSSVIELSDGTEQPLKAGSLVLMEDTTGAGHGGRFGPCGYVAVDLQYKPVVPIK